MDWEQGVPAFRSSAPILNPKHFVYSYDPLVCGTFRYTGKECAEVVKAPRGTSGCNKGCVVKRDAKGEHEGQLIN
jgi:hypothetical protein